MKRVRSLFAVLSLFVSCFAFSGEAQPFSTTVCGDDALIEFFDTQAKGSNLETDYCRPAVLDDKMILAYSPSLSLSDSC